jgi:hypothetical protein
MSSYRLYGLTLRSDCPLPELPEIADEDRDLLFRVDPEPVDVRPSTDWFHVWRAANGNVWLSFSKLGQGYLLRFPDLADFAISKDKSEIAARTVPGVPPETIRHLLLDQVVPLVLSGRSDLVLHASSPLVEDHAILFLGAAGYGKSTLAGSFWSAGFQLLTDDGLLLRVVGKRVLGIPSYPGLRLWPDSARIFETTGPVLADVAHYTDKKRLLRPGRPTTSPLPEAAPVAAAYVLGEPGKDEPGGTIRIEELSGATAMMELSNNAFRLDVTDRKGLRQDVERAAEVVGLIPFRKLSFFRDYSMLPAVRDAVLADLRALSSDRRDETDDKRRATPGQLRQERGHPSALQTPTTKEMKPMRPILLGDRVRIPADVVHKKVADETVLLDLDAGVYFGLDPVGTRVWEILAGQGDLRLVVETMVREYDAAPDDIARDVLDLIQRLAEKGLVEIVRPSPKST